MGIFNTVSRWNKAWILAAVLSLTMYDLYWVRGTYSWIYVRLLENVPDLLAKYPNFYIDHVAGTIADTLRLVAVLLLLVAAYLAWGSKKQPFTAVKKYITISILFEAIYWLAILPYNLLSISRERIPLLLYIGFAVQILVAAPLLLILSAKIWRYTQGARSNLIKWSCIAGIGYIFGMWINNIFRWFSMSGIFGLTDPRLNVDLLSGTTALGFLNTAITLTSSLAFAIAGSYMLVKRNNHKLALRLIGLAILMFGLYFAFYIVYSWFAPGTWAFVMLTEIWPVPLIGLGIGMLRGKV